MKGDIKKALRFPEAIRRRLRATVVRPFLTPSYTPLSYPAEDWDTLVILDACRYDLFTEYNPFDAEVQKRFSNGSHTTEFLINNFENEYPNIIYVTASPQLVGYEQNFAHTEHVWAEDWSEEHRTVPPKAVTDAAIRVADEYPNKRLIVHYMQPHYPFIGPTGNEIDNYATYRHGKNHDEWVRNHPSVWELLSAGEVDRETVKKAYAENLELALPEVTRLTEALSGKTVVSSDHGNLFGTRVSVLPVKIYGHPPRIPHPELTAVPWVELPFDQRRKITESKTESQKNVNEELVEERLQDLGYV